MALISLDEAQHHVLGLVEPLAGVVRPIGDVVGCVTVDALVARDAVPPFDNSSVDGFAVRAADVEDATEADPVVLVVIDTVLAGSVPTRSVGPGQAVRIMTGAPLPAGADAVVMVERTSLTAPVDATGFSTSPAGFRTRVEPEPDAVVPEAEPEVEHVHILEPVRIGAAVRKRGSDIAAGVDALEAGTELRPTHIGLLANLGLTEVEVTRRPVVGVLSTGDELVEAPHPLGPGQIRDSNRVALLALLAEGGFEPVDLGIVGDDRDAIVAAITDGVARCDALITSGGVSMGDVDLVKVVLGELGEMRWMQIAIRPAKPFAFGVIPGGRGRRPVPVFGVPGNPVSSLVSFELLARPALRKMMGHPVLHRLHVIAVADEELSRRPDGKVHFARVTCRYGEDGLFHVRASGGQGSHQLAALAGADGLAILPDGEGVTIGDGVEVLLLR